MTAISLRILLLCCLCLTGCDQHIEVAWENLPQVNSVAFNGSDMAWLVTARERDLLHTEDGGASWRRISRNAVGGFEGVSFIDAQHGWAVSENGQVWRTTNSGQAWSVIARLGSFNSADQIQFVDDSHGWIIETFGVWHTEDGGMNWVERLSTLSPGVRGQPVRGSFINSRLAWVCGTNGQVYRSEDGGRTWQIQMVASAANSFNTTSFTDIYFINERVGWLTGYTGGQFGTRLYSTSDGGTSWQPRSIAGDETLINSTHFISESEGWAVGRTWSTGANRTRRGAVLHTTDGGQNWHPVQVGENDPFFDRIHFTDSRHGWLIARDNVYRTEDGGQTWRTVLQLPPVRNSSN